MKKFAKALMYWICLPILAICLFAYGYWAGSNNSMGVLNTNGLLFMSGIVLAALLFVTFTKTEE
jgi:hypothetical protein